MIQIPNRLQFIHRIPASFHHQISILVLDLPTKFSPILSTIILSSSVFFAGGDCRKIRALKCRKMMHMTFYWGKEVTILFDGWKTTTWLSYTLSLLAIFLLSAFYQYMENRRIKLQLAASARYAKSSAAAASPGLDAPLLFSAAKMRVPKFASAFLFGLNSAVGYMIMLAVMSFNAGVFIAAVVGLAAGYLVFRSELEGGVAATVTDNSCAYA